MVDTDQAGFHVSGWKSLMDRHSLGVGGGRGGGGGDETVVWLPRERCSIA